MSCPSISVMNCGYALSRASCSASRRRRASVRSSPGRTRPARRIPSRAARGRPRACRRPLPPAARRRTGCWRDGAEGRRGRPGDVDPERTNVGLHWVDSYVENWHGARATHDESDQANRSPSRQRGGRPRQPERPRGSVGRDLPPASVRRSSRAACGPETACRRPVSSLAGCGVSRTTASVAYDRLSSEGLAVAAVGAGTFVGHLGAQPARRAGVRRRCAHSRPGRRSRSRRGAGTRPNSTSAPASLTSASSRSGPGAG